MSWTWEEPSGASCPFKRRLTYGVSLQASVRTAPSGSCRSSWGTSCSTWRRSSTSSTSPRRPAARSRRARSTSGPARQTAPRQATPPPPPFLAEGGGAGAGRGGNLLLHQTLVLPEETSWHTNRNTRVPCGVLSPEAGRWTFVCFCFLKSGEMQKLFSFFFPKIFSKRSEFDLFYVFVPRVLLMIRIMI